MTRAPKTRSSLIRRFTFKRGSAIFVWATLVAGLMLPSQSAEAAIEGLKAPIFSSPAIFFQTSFRRSEVSRTPDSAGPQAQVLEVLASGETPINFATPSRFAGARAAVQFLKDQGISLSRRRDILSTFEVGTIKLRYAGKNEFGIRYFDDVKAGARGHYLFETFPATREGLALKTEWNQIRGMKQWQIAEGTIIIEGVAAPQGHWSGGSKQMFILDKGKLKEVPER